MSEPLSTLLKLIHLSFYTLVKIEKCFTKNSITAQIKINFILFNSSCVSTLKCVMENGKISIVVVEIETKLRHFNLIY